MIGMAKGSYDEAQRWVGRRLEPRGCDEPVNRPQTNLFCALVQDSHPIYWDAQYSIETHGAEVAPPGTLMGWALPSPWRPDREGDIRPLWALVPLPGETIINASTSTEFFRPLHIGDELTVEEAVVTISPLKGTSLGQGHFLTTRTTYRAVDGEEVALHDNTLFRYSPGGPEVSRAVSRPQSASLHSGGVDPEDRTPHAQVTIPITRELCVLDVAATRDFYPGHYDRDHAVGQGLPDTFVNTMFHHGLADRLGAMVVGPSAYLQQREISMHSPACVGDVVTAIASPVSRGREPEATTVDVEIEISVGDRSCASARSRWDLPERAR